MIEEKKRRVLVYRTGQIGDTLVALPALWALRTHFANDHLCLFTDRQSNNNYVLAATVLPKEGLFDEWLTYPANIFGVDPWKMPSTFQQIRNKCFDTLVYLMPTRRPRWKVQRDLCFFRLAGINQFIAHRWEDPLKRPANGTPLPSITHEVDFLLERLSRSGISVPLPENRVIDLRLTHEEYDEANSWIGQTINNIPKDVKLIAIGPGSKYPAKIWPLERLIALGKQLIDKWNIFPIVFGGPEDFSLGQQLIAEWGIGANAASKLSVRGAAAAMKSCQLYIGNDTGTMHLAVAAGIPCVAIFSAIDWPGRWYPYGSGHIVLRRTVPCEGCQLQICTQNGLLCLKQIQVQDVMDAVERKLSGDLINQANS